MEAEGTSTLRWPRLSRWLSGAALLACSVACGTSPAPADVDGAVHDADLSVDAAQVAVCSFAGSHIATFEAPRACGTVPSITVAIEVDPDGNVTRGGRLDDLVLRDDSRRRRHVSRRRVPCVELLRLPRAARANRRRRQRDRHVRSVRRQLPVRLQLGLVGLAGLAPYGHVMCRWGVSDIRTKP